MFAPEDGYYDSNEWYALGKSYKDKFLKARRRINVGKKSSYLGGLLPYIYPAARLKELVLVTLT